MKILFIGYWGLTDPLTLATTFPNLEILANSPQVEHITLATIEREGVVPILELPFETNKISFQPLMSSQGWSLFVTKTEEFIRFPRELAKEAIKLGITHIIGRGAMAGALAMLTAGRTGLPFFVESFEPHADYMRDAGVWHKYDPRYIFQHYWEKREKKYARGLMPVANNYRRQLLTEGMLAERVITVPCAVNPIIFAFRPVARLVTRQRLGLSEAAIVGIYVGKFGGIYYDQEAFQLFREAADAFGPAFHLLLLSPIPAHEIRAKLIAAGVTEQQATILFVPFVEVPDYLSAADFAFGLHRPTPYVSPVKVGEYWANGLPVLLTEGVGDDSDIIHQHPIGGAVFNISHPDSILQALNKIAFQIRQPNYRIKTQLLAQHYRSLDYSRKAYAQLLGIDTGSLTHSDKDFKNID